AQVLASTTVTAEQPQPKLSGLGAVLGKIKIGDAASKNTRTSSPFTFFIQKVNVSVKVQPESTWADIAFTTREPAHGLVEVSTRKSNDFPDTTPAGQQPAPAFPPGAVTMSINDNLGAKGTQHTLRVNGLLPSTTYYFVISATGADGRTFRYWDSFFTATNLTVKVVFEKLGLASAVRHLWFDVTSKDAATARELSQTGEVGAENYLTAGQDLNKALTIENALNLLTVQVKASHWTWSDGLTHAHTTRDTAEYDLTRFPGRNVKVPFKIAGTKLTWTDNRGQPLEPFKEEACNPQFEVTGHLEITRPSPLTINFDALATRASKDRGGAFGALKAAGKTPDASLLSQSATPVAGQSAASAETIASVFSNQSRQSSTREARDRKPPVSSPSVPATGSTAVIYAIAADGTLQWRRHNGAASGGGLETWQGATTIGTGWGDFKQVFSDGEGVLYAIDGGGVLKWYRHTGYESGAPTWEGPQNIGTGWGDFKQVFSGGAGVIYAISNDGTIRWHKHTGYRTGAPTWEGPKEAGSGWQNYKQVFSAGNGIIYAIRDDGKMYWTKHLGYADGARAWTEAKEVGSDWQTFKQVFCAGMGGRGAIIYAITEDGKLLWNKQTGYRDGTKIWLDAVQVGNGWQNFSQVFAFMSAPG
ncbi:MAG: tachylectin-related carbohydrate-binding protein, partial [Armatimonadota bacterium]|nr:tachylectin-related carbohydrate-binding protein [Armatimonadota bacterium]